MESAERLQHHIDTLSELHNIVRTMKALSAASIRQYERAVQSLAEYNHTVELGLQVALQDMESTHYSVHARSKTQSLAVIVFGSDHGLCGRFNEDIASYTLRHLEASGANPENCRLLAIGSRIAAKLRQAGQLVDEEFLLPGSAPRITATVQQLLLKIDEWRNVHKIHHVTLFYNRRLSGDRYHPIDIELLPVNLHRFRHPEAIPWPSRRLPRFTMGRKDLLTALLRQYFFASIFQACAESQACEHVSRLAAMQSAEKNLDERLDEVTMKFRHLRQEAITTELLDVVSGFEAIMTKGH